MSLFAIAAQLEAQNVPFAMAMITESKGSAPRHSGQILVTQDGRTHGSVGGGMMERKVIEEALLALEEGKSRTFHGRMARQGQDAVGSDCGGAMSVFISVHSQQPRLLLIGGGHVNRAIAQAAGALDFSVAVTDIYAPNLQPQDFPPGTHLLLGNSFTDTIEQIAPDEHSYVVIATNSSDREVLGLLIGKPCRYLGLLASKRKVQTFIKQLQEAGICAEQLAQLRSPIGFDIGAETPAEIAISVLSEILSIKNATSGQLMHYTPEDHPIEETSEVGS